MIATILALLGGGFVAFGIALLLSGAIEQGVKNGLVDRSGQGRDKNGN